jgi:hypothetical protein
MRFSLHRSSSSRWHGAVSSWASVEQWVTDQGAGHDLGVMDSPPSPRINPYQLCEAPLVLAVVATASQHGVSGRGFVAETGQQDDVGARRREGMSSPLRKASMSGSSAISSRATSGRRPQIAKVGVVDDIRRAYRTGSSIAALARAHRVSRRDPHRGRGPTARPTGATGGQHGQDRRGRAGDGASGDPRQDRPSPARPQRPGRDRTARCCWPPPHRWAPTARPARHTASMPTDSPPRRF